MRKAALARHFSVTAPRERTRKARPTQRLEAATCVAAAVVAAIYGARARADDANPQESTGLPEVVVTATRREASAQDIPLSITAVSGADLTQSGIEDIAQLAQSMAGVNFTDKGPFSGVNGSGLIIRGLNSEGTAGQLALATPVVPPVATYVDDTPLYFNLQLQDLDRVEILRGPQGTLYGSGSLGGTIRFVQNAPDPSGFDARGEIGMSDTYHTHAPNEDIKGMLNLPLTDTLAVRMNVGYSYNAGFINQPNLYATNAAGEPIAAQPGNVFSQPVTYAKDGTNSYDYHIASIAVLWKPSDQFHAQFNYYYQLGQAYGFPYVATSSAAYNMPLGAGATAGAFATCATMTCLPGPLSQLLTGPVPPGVDKLSNADNALDGAHDSVNLLALTLEGDLGFATLTSDTSLAHHINHSYDDLTAVYTNFGFFQSIYGQDPRTLVVGHDELLDRPWSEELRLASKLGGKLDWVAGLFYKNEYQNIQEHEYDPGYLDFFNSCSGIYGPETEAQFLGNLPSYCGVGETAYTPGVATSVDGIPIVKDQTYIGDFETHFTDLAAFGEATWHITQAWSLTGGTRVFKQTVSQSQQTGLLFDGGGIFAPTGCCGPPPIANSSLSDSWSRALWKVNTSFQLDKTDLIYATWSQGFRRGGVNALPPAEPAENYVTPQALTKLQPDTADNYELGVKGTIANRFRYSADIYDIQWTNIQEGVQLTPLVLPASLNVGNAFSRGFETEIEALLTRQLSLNVDYTFDQTRLTSVNPLDVNESVPPPVIGSPLPGTPKNSLVVGPAYDFGALGGQWRIAASAHYQSDILPALSSTVPTAAGFTMVDARISYSISHWLASFYVNNIGNILGITSYSDPAIYGNRDQAIVSTPRTFGVTLAYSFKGQ
jgi:outer membrane receptor protein involved in Fe transport